LLRSASDKPGSTARIWEALGQAHMLRKDNASARTALERARQLDPKSSFARRASAQMLIETDPVEALSQAESALTLTSSSDLETQNVIGLAAMAVARAKEQRKDAAGARQASERASEAFGVIVAAQPTNAGAILNFIAAKDGAGRIAETLPYFETLMTLSELPRGVDKAGVQNNFADAIVRSGRTGTELDRALAMAQSAVKAMPVAATLDTLANVQRARGDRIQAIATYREALAKDKNLVSARLGLAKALVEGTADEQAEAAKIAAGLRGEGVSLPADLSNKLK
jgi:tetratricopeptide (TPR) repeat protein